MTDYAALAAQVGGTTVNSATPAKMDYAALAAQAGGETVSAPSLGDSLKRAAGLTARYALEGVGGVAGALGDAVASAANGISRAMLPSAPGAYQQSLGMPSTTIQSGIDALGLPSPQGSEVLPGSVARAVAGAAAPIKAASVLADASPLNSIWSVLTKAPAAQAVGAAGGAASGEEAKNAGFGPTGQAVAAALGGVVAPTAASLATQGAAGLGRTLSAAVQPFTKSGQEDIVGNILARFAQNPAAAKANLSSAPEYVEGSLPTTAQASRDIGLAQLERGLANSDTAFAQRAADNNTARVRALALQARTPEELNAALDARSLQANADYAAASNTPLRGVETAEGVAPFVQLMQKPAFQQAVKTAQRLALNDGIDLSNVDQLFDQPRGMHYIKLALDDQISTAPQQGLGKAEQRAIISVKNEFLDWLDQANPAYANARQNFAQASGPINQMQTLQDIAKRTQVAAPDAEGNPILSQAKWKNVVTNNIDELGKTLSPDQIATLRNIGDDLDRGMVSAAGKAVGSNTVQNLTTANVLGAAVGNKWGDSTLARTLAKPLSWLYNHVAEDDTQALLKKAMLDPLTASLLMSKANPRNVEALSDVLLSRFKALIQGTATGTAAQTTQQ